MVLADTSVWIDHLRKGQPRLARLLRDGAVASHSFVIGELACGNLANRTAFFAELNTLPRVLCSSHEEALQFIETRKLWGRGIGWVDVHLLASALLSNCELWTLDVRLKQVGLEAGVKTYI